MITKKMEKALNEQINKEMYTSNLYLSMCSYFLDKDLDGIANFFRVQSQEELFHAQKQFDYIHDAGGKATISALDAPPTNFKSTIEVFQKTLAHEQLVSKSINNLAKLAMQESDFATYAFLQWFLTEQVEEEATVNNLLSKLKMIGDNTSALYLLNTELKTRTFTPGAE
jgi:ferritin